MTTKNAFYISILLIAMGCNSPDKTGSLPFQNASDTPALLGFGNISTSEFHESINHISDDGKAIYFTRSDKDFESSAIYSSQFSLGKWSKPKILSFSGTYYDTGIILFKDSAFFTSKRPTGQSNLSNEWNIWKVVIEDGNWSEPEILPAPINSNNMECCFTMNENGDTYFSSNRNGSWDIYYTKYQDGQFTNIESLEINSPKGEWPGHISKSADVLFFSSTRAGGLGGDDIYVSEKVNGFWTSPILPNSEINSHAYEDNPRMSVDGRLLFFSSWKDTNYSVGVSNIYYMISKID